MECVPSALGRQKSWAFICLLLVCFLLCVKVSHQACTPLPSMNLMESAGASNVYNCCTPFTGNIHKVAYSQRTSRWYWLAGPDVWTSTTNPTVITNTNQATLVGSLPVTFGSGRRFGRPLFLLNPYGTPSNPTVDDLLITNPIFAILPMIAEARVGNSGPISFTVTNLASPADSLIPAYDPTYNVTWFAGQVSGGHVISWVNMATKEQISQTQSTANVVDDLIIIPQRQIAVWTQSQGNKVFWTPLSNNPFSPTGYQASLVKSFNIISPVGLFYVPSRDTLLVGTKEVGILAEVEISTMTITRASAFIIGADRLRGFWFFKDANVANVVHMGSFVSTRFYVVRLDVRTLTAIDLQGWQYPSRASGIRWPGPDAIQDPLNPGTYLTGLYADEGFYAFSDAGWKAEPTCIQKIDTYDCSLFTSCSSCNTDSTYCGWCARSQICTDSASKCTETGDVWEKDGQCPAATFSLPRTLPSDGGVNITLFGSSFVNGSVCDFSVGSTTFASNVPAVVISKTSISCVVPPAPPGVTSSDTINVQVEVASKNWTSPYSFTYFTCDPSSNCSSCLSTSGCAWCLRSNKCTSQRNCTATNDVWSLDCPAIRGVSPSSISAFGGERVRFSTTGVILDGSTSYQVKFGSAAPVAAQIETSAKRSLTEQVISATAPAASIGSGSLPLSVELTRTSDSALILSSSTSMSIYDCSQFTSCGTCFAAGSKCSWCPNSAICKDSSSPTPTGCSTAAGACPTISSITPNVSFVATSTVLTITGTNFNNLPSSGLNCIFADASTTYVSPISSRTSTSITCPALTTLAIGVYQVGVGVSLSSTNTVQLEVFDCTATLCGDCIAPGKTTQCAWCNDVAGTWGCIPATGTCAVSVFSSASLCPSIFSTNPSFVPTGTTPSITLSGSFGSISSASTTCKFTTSAGTSSTSSTAATTTSVSCPAVNSATAETVAVSVEYQARPYTESSNIQYVTCSAVTNCSSCKPEFGCTWCSNGCVTSGTCAAPISTCPVAISVTPNLAMRTGGDSVIVRGGPFVAGTTYGCQFGTSQVVGTALTSSTVSCIVPAYPTSELTQFRLMDSSFTVQYAENALDFTFIECPILTSTVCSSACVAYPAANGASLEGCGYCVSTGGCVSQVRCAGLWTPSCLSTANLNQDYALLGGDDVIRMTIDNPPQLPFGSSFFPTDFICDFGQAGTTYATLSEVNSTGQYQLSCNSPIVSGPLLSTFQLFYKTTAVSTTSTFRFIDCSIANDCGSCLALNPCGWCLDTQSCSSVSQCPLGNYTSVQCPDIRGLVPSSGSTKGGEKVLVKGSRFIPNNLLSVRFGSTYVNTRYVDASTLEVITPKIKEEGDVQVQLFWNRSSRYSDGSQLFSFSDPPSAAQAIGLGVGLSLGIILIAIAVILIACILYKRKVKNAILFSVKEPDYQAVAFGSDLALAYKMPADSYGFLETVLCRYNFSLQVSIAAVAPSTEEDLVAKSMLYVAQAHGLSVGMINSLVRGEIHRCLEENTIFRNNSVASKSFKFYSRVVGIPYLWKCMARVIAELEVLGQRSDKEKHKNRNTTSLLSVTMEVDMDRFEGEAATSDVDSEVNALQLKLTCQKLFSVLVKNGVGDIPAEFRKIFVEIDTEIMKKFNSDMAVYKAIGGFFFLRFVCPSITAPHYYGLLDRPPNETTQRQLVLISKVIQSLANMQMPGRKEAYMEALSDFIEKNMGSVVKFYQDMREASKVNTGPSATMDVPEEIRLNALASLWDFIHTNNAKLVKDITEKGDPEFREQLLKDMQTLSSTYPNKPKKITQEDKNSSKSPRSKKSRKTKM